jgi:penicillin-insensitive murein endopeptidase
MRKKYSFIRACGLAGFFLISSVGASARGLENDFIPPPPEFLEAAPEYFSPDDRVQPNESDDDRDLRLGPWLDLKGGGIAVGDSQGVVVANPDGTFTGAYGSLVNGSLVPASGPGFKRAGGAAQNYAAGFMLSLLENASAYITQAYPGLVVQIGGISQQTGGFFPPHKSHQNGLDADILFMGRTTWESVLDKERKVTARFDLVKNWEFWRQLTAQQYSNKGKVESIVSMILVAPEIKRHLCAWAMETGALNDPLNFEVMRRLRPTEGHEDHFHLRLRCSPYHVECLKSYAPPKVSGCEV